MEEGQELSAEQTATLQPQMGNQAILNLLNRLQDASNSFSNIEMEEEQEQEEEGLEQEEGLESEMDFHHLGGGSGSGGGGGTGEHPWEVGFLFGGDDDEGGPAAPRRRRRQQRARQQDEADDPFEEEFEELSKSDLSSIEVAIGPTQPRRQQNRWGDAHYRAVEDSLMDPTRLGRQSLTPESLIGHSGPQDPLGRPAAIGRFLSTALPNSSVAGLLSGPAPSLMTAASGYAGAAARLACLAVCAEASIGGEKATDDAVALAMVQDAWPQAVEAARHAAKRGRLHAPLIAAMVLGEPESLPAARMRLSTPHPLGGQALERSVPDSFIPPIPTINLTPPPPPPAVDEALAAADAVLARLTGGPDPFDPPAPPTLTPESIRPVLRSANALMSAMGKAQVEAAAAAIAVRKIRKDAPIRSPLAHTDKALRELARGVITAGRMLERIQGRPLMEVQDSAKNALQALRDGAAALGALRSWMFATLAGALHAQAA